MNNRSAFVQKLSALTKEKNLAQPSESELGRLLAQVLHLKALERRTTAHSVAQRLIQPADRERLEKMLRAIGNAAPSGRRENTVFRLLGQDTGLGDAVSVGEIVVPEIFDALPLGGFWGYMDPRPVDAESGKFSVATTRPAARAIVTEGDALDDDSAAAGTSVLTPTQLVGVAATFSLEWVMDAGRPLLDAWLAMAVESINSWIDTAVLQGDGTANATYGGITGVYNAGSIPTVNCAAGNTTVQSIGRSDLINVISAVEGSANQHSPRWAAHPDLLGPLMQITDSAGRPVLKTSAETGSDEDFCLVGMPLSLTPGGPSTNSAAQKVLCYGRPGAMAVGITRDIEIMASSHKSFSTGGIVYRVLLRVGAKMKRVQSWGILKTASV